MGGSGGAGAPPGTSGVKRVLFSICFEYSCYLTSPKGLWGSLGVPFWDPGRSGRVRGEVWGSKAQGVSRDVLEVPLEI